MSADLAGQNVFVTGGLGFIGSHTVLVLLDHGAKVTVIDNLNNSYTRVFRHMQKLAGDKAGNMKFVQCDILDREGLEALFSAEKFDSVIHCAGFKAVGESAEKPLEYYRNNFCGTVTLLEAMAKYNVTNMVFSSSCTVYGLPKKTPVTEDTPLAAISCYGRTKLFQEDMFRDLHAGHPEWRILLLRYFNPVGAHASGQLGEHPVGVPNNLMPFVQQVALGQRAVLHVFGDDYPTPNGTATRDYIHVTDVAEGHVAALKKIMTTDNFGCRAINLGTGTVCPTRSGTSVLEMIKAFEKASGKTVAYTIQPRRAGDSVAVWGATEKAERELGWKTKLDVHDMCRDQWLWATNYPQGYDTPEAHPAPDVV